MQDSKIFKILFLVIFGLIMFRALPCSAVTYEAVANIASLNIPDRAAALSLPLDTQFGIDSSNSVRLAVYDTTSGTETFVTSASFNAISYYYSAGSKATLDFSYVSGHKYKLYVEIGLSSGSLAQCTASCMTTNPGYSILTRYLKNSTWTDDSCPTDICIGGNYPMRVAIASATNISGSYYLRLPVATY